MDVNAKLFNIDCSPVYTVELHIVINLLIMIGTIDQVKCA